MTSPDPGAADALPVGSDRWGGSAAPVKSQSKRLLMTIIGLTVVVAVLDQLSKVLALSRLDEGADTIWFVGELLGWKLLFNPGAALSIGTGMTWVLTLVALIVVVVVVRISRQIGSVGWALAFGLLLGGAIGNLIDRFFREPGIARGHVVDFINYGGFFVGNVADIAIVLAAVLIAGLSIRGVAISGARESDQESDVKVPEPATVDEVGHPDEQGS